MRGARARLGSIETTANRHLAEGGLVGVEETGAAALRTVEVRDLFLTTDPAHPRRFLRLHAGP